MGIIIKQQIVGSINPRWSKKKIVRWLEWGAVPAILGLWIPDWSGGYIQLLSTTPGIKSQWGTFPPMLTYIGALILFKACIEGVKNMGYHYRGVLWCGWTAVTFAGLSCIWHFLIEFNSSFYGALTLLFIWLAAFFSVGFFWFTIAKVAEISAETRTLWTQKIVIFLGVTALLTGAVTVILIYYQHPWFVYLLRSTLLLFTLTFGFCRYGIYCYKSQRSIGANHTILPNDQYWI
jgi:hypothetical protein